LLVRFRDDATSEQRCELSLRFGGVETSMLVGFRGEKVWIESIFQGPYISLSTASFVAVEEVRSLLAFMRNDQNGLCEFSDLEGRVYLLMVRDSTGLFVSGEAGYPASIWSGIGNRLQDAYGCGLAAAKFVIRLGARSEVEVADENVMDRFVAKE
jgi:hypothetical protein